MLLATGAWILMTVIFDDRVFDSTAGSRQGSIVIAKHGHTGYCAKFAIFDSAILVKAQVSRKQCDSDVVDPM